MSRYATWNNALIKRQLRESKNNPNYQYDYQILSQIISKTIPIFQRTEIDEEVQATYLFEIFKEDILLIKNLRNIFEDCHDIELTCADITDSVLLSYTHDFYSSIENKDIRKAFQKAFKNRGDNFKFSSERGVELFLPEHKYVYIRSNRNNTIEDFSNIIHEYGHAISDYINYHNNIYVYPFIELPALFFSLISFDKISDMFELTTGLEREINNYKKIELNTIITNADHIDKFEQLISEFDNLTHKKIKFILGLEYKLNENEISYFLNHTNLERYAYVIPYMAAIELYYIYKKDPEYALNLLVQIININESENYIDTLNKLGINLNEHSEDYARSLK